MSFPNLPLQKLLSICMSVIGFINIKRLIRTFSFLFLCSVLFASVTKAQVTSPANINGGNPIGPNNIGGTTTNTQNFGSLAGLGLNQGESFTFTGEPNGAALWNGGFQFLNNQILQFQADNSPIPASPVDYEINFTDAVYGLQFSMGGLDNADDTIITFFRNNVPVPVTVSTYVNGGVTVPRTGNIISFAGTNIDIIPSGDGFRADGDANNDTGGIGIHGAQEGFSIALPIGVAVDEVRLSQTGKNNGNGSNVTLILTDFAWARPNIAVTKLDSFSQGGNGESNVGDIITYAYTITNNGNVPINDLTLIETGFSGTGATPVPVFSSGTGGATPTNLPQGETLTYIVNYPATASDLLTGFVNNQATVNGLAGDDVVGQEISDLSDSENVGDGGAQASLNEDDPNRTDFPTPIVFNPSIEAVKIVNEAGLTDPVIAGNLLVYTIIVSNTGDVDLSNVTLVDALTDGNNITITPSPTPVFQSSTLASAVGELIVGESATYEFTYTVTQSDIDSGLLSNSVTASADPFPGTGGAVSDLSDDDDDADGNTVNDSTVTPLVGVPELIVTKTANDTTDVQAGQIIVYTYRITNTGNLTITNVSLVDAHGGSGPAPIPEGEALSNDVSPINDSIDTTSGANGIWDSLAPGDEITFTATYVITQQDVDTLQ